MESNYKCFIDIHFEGGNIQIDVSDGTQLFSFKSGLGFIAIPHFFFTLVQLYKGEIKEAQLDCHGNSDYYRFLSDGVNLFIEYTTNYPKENIYKYKFNLENYLEAIDKGFKWYFKQLESEGILPLKTQDFGHPLGDDVLDAFNDFSTHLNN
ncbi:MULTISPECIES: hypothetical protein [unclassified Sutcliffiella]|uniref:hypothetical protein n=1 Tax=unclassified Sutcliffiella TaxID=2837532 RepID=UPI0030CF401A